MLFNFNNNDFDFILGEAGTEILINGTPSRALITNNPLSESKDTKKITTLDNVERGFLVDYDNSKWLVVSGDKRYSKYKGIMQKCNNTFTLNVGGVLHKVHCIVTDKVSLNTDATTYITTLDTEIYILVANDSINGNIKVNDIYKIGRKNYSVEGIDDIGKPGLLVLKMKFTASEQVLPNYSITITNTEPLTTNTDAPVQLTVEQKDGNTILTEPLPVVFVSSDNLVATVDSNGLVTPVSVGSVIISVSLESDASVSDSIAITIEEVPVIETYTLELTGNVQPDTEIKQGQTKTYTCVKRNNSGVVVDGATFDFTIDPEITSADKYVFTVLNDTQCTIKSNGGVYYIKLIATDRADSSLTVSKRIQLKALW